MENPDSSKIKHGGTISALTRTECAVITSAVRSETRIKAAASAASARHDQQLVGEVASHLPR